MPRITIWWVVMPRTPTRWIIVPFVAILVLTLLGSLAEPTRAAEPAPPPLPLGRTDFGREGLIVSSSGDLWITGLDGGMASRLTSGPAWDDLPILSPDESTIAFARSFDGENDLYTMPARAPTSRPEGGDTLPWMFRRAGLGTLVGTRTTGAGIGGYISIPTLIDGGELGIPTRGFYNPDGQWDIENGGVSPDIPVEITPTDWRAGRDPQLERAVEEALSGIDEKPAARKNPRGTLPPG